MSSIYRNQNGAGSWREFFGDVYSGIAIGIGHPVWFVNNCVERTLYRGWVVVTSVVSGTNDCDEKGDDSDSSSLSSSAKSLKVVGVGYGRTGTYSLALALDELGFPTLHTQHLYENDELFDHLTNNIFYKSIQDDEVIMGKPDFDLLLKAGYTATMDLPFALYFDQIKEKYPKCKFILTVRPPDDWFRSWKVLTSSITQPAQYTSFIFTHVKKLEYYLRWLFSVVNSEKTFLSHPFPLPSQDKENAINSYLTHNQRVRESIPESQLLEYNVRQGWDPLCKFLEIPFEDCPSSKGIPFPKSNSARAVKWQSYSAFIGPMMLTLYILLSLLLVLFRLMIGVRFIPWCRKKLGYPIKTLVKERRISKKMN